MCPFYNFMYLNAVMYAYFPSLVTVATTCFSPTPSMCFLLYSCIHLHKTVLLMGTDHPKVAEGCSLPFFTNLSPKDPLRAFFPDTVDSRVQVIISDGWTSSPFPKVGFCIHYSCIRVCLLVKGVGVLLSGGMKTCIVCCVLWCHSTALSLVF